MPIATKSGRGWSDPGALLESESRPLADMLLEAAALRDAGHGRRVTFSKKVFIPLTKLCRDVCHYCTFAESPSRRHAAYLKIDEVLAIAEQGRRAGCHEALFTLGDKPELRYNSARRELDAMGFETTISYLAHVSEQVWKQTGLLPHLNPGVLTHDELAMLRPVSASMGLMLESTSSPVCVNVAVRILVRRTSLPAVRLGTIAAAGELRIPFTTGILIGIGETRKERTRISAAIGELQARYGHIQEVIVQNFRAKAGTRLAQAAEPDLDDLRWTLAAARIILGSAMNIQAPPNLMPDSYAKLIEAGLNDWGGISPVTPDHVNPEAAWPAIDALADATAAEGHLLVERLTIYPEYVKHPEIWLDRVMAPAVRMASDSDGLARESSWSPGVSVSAAEVSQLLQAPRLSRVDRQVAAVVAKALSGTRLEPRQVTTLLQTRDVDFKFVRESADELRKSVAGDVVRYVVNRNINYTNICYFKCGFCAFSKGKAHASLRGKPYDLALEEVSRRVSEACARGATEVCMQGGIHPDYTGETYLRICRAVKQAVPEMHIHAFSPLEIAQGAKTLSIGVTEFLVALKEAGLGSLPGTAAEILDDSVRAVICPDKLRTAEWLDVIESAHRVGIRTTATIMFGHVDGPENWATHLLAIRDLQARTGGFTEFVPLPFIPMEAPIFLKGGARRGPTLRETVLMHAVSRLVLHPLIPNIQTSWVKLGEVGGKLCLQAGANDLGGTLMNESISRAAGTQHGQEMPPAAMQALISSLGRQPAQRSTLYQEVPLQVRKAAETAGELSPIVLTRATDRRALSRLSA